MYSWCKECVDGERSIHGRINNHPLTWEPLSISRKQWLTSFMLYAIVLLSEPSFNIFIIYYSKDDEGRWRTMKELRIDLWSQVDGSPCPNWTTQLYFMQFLVPGPINIWWHRPRSFRGFPFSKSPQCPNLWHHVFTNIYDSLVNSRCNWITLEGDSYISCVLSFS